MVDVKWTHNKQRNMDETREENKQQKKMKWWKKESNKHKNIALAK